LTIPVDDEEIDLIAVHKSERSPLLKETLY